MSTFYFSCVSHKSEPVVEKVAAACESFLEGKCISRGECDGFISEKIKKNLVDCDALFVVVGKELPVNESSLDKRLRFEVVTAMNLGLLIVLLLVDDVRLPKKRNAPGIWKHLLECKSYRLRTVHWSEDLQEFLEDVGEELDFKREVEKKLSQSIYQNYQELKDAEGRPLQPLELGLKFSGALELRRVIESERFNLEEARRMGNRSSEKNALSALALAFTQLGQTQRAIQYFQEQLTIVRKAEDAEEECELLASLGDAFALSGDIEAAKKSYEEQLVRADSKGFRTLVGSAYNGLGYVYVKQGKIERAIECYLKALAIYQEFKNYEKELELLVGIGLNFQKTGAWEEAAEYLEQALQVAKYLENRKEEAHILVDLIESYCRLENPKLARNHLSRAEELLSHRTESWANALNGRFSMIRDSLDRE